MACCYIAASFIGFIIRSCDALDINLHLQYNESVEHSYEDAEDHLQSDQIEKVDLSGFTVVSIRGMTCAACTSTVESSLKEVQGVNEALVSLPLQEARVLHEPSVRSKAVVDANEAVGNDAVAGERAAERKISTLRHTEELSMLRDSLKGLSLYSGAIFAPGTLLDYSGWDTLLNSTRVKFMRTIMLFCMTAVAVGKHGHWIFLSVTAAAKHLRVNMHTLITALGDRWTWRQV